MTLEKIIDRLTARFPVERIEAPSADEWGCATRKNVVLYWETTRGFRARLNLDCGISFYANGGSADLTLKRMLRDVDFHFEARTMSAIFVGKIAYPIVDRRYLYDYENHVERHAPDGIIHWWVKGDDEHHWFKCDIHLPEASLEGLGDTLLEAVMSLSAQIAEVTNSEQPLAGDNAGENETKNDD